MLPPCSGYAHDPSPGDAPGLPSDARMLLVQSLELEEDLTKATEALLEPLAVIITLDMGDLRLAGTLTPQPPVTTCTTEDTQDIPPDLAPTRALDLRQAPLLLLPVHQEHHHLQRRHPCLNPTTSTR